MDVTTLLDELSHASTEESAVSVIERLGALQQAKAVGPLVQKLKSSTEQERLAICEALGMIGDARAVAPLVSMLKDDAESIRGEAFSALVSIGDKRSRFMPPEAKGDSDSDPRMALTQIAWPADIDAIHMLLNSVSDPDPEIRIGCAYTLGRLGIGAALDKLANLLKTDGDADVRAAAAFGLGDLGEAGDSRVGLHLIDAWPANRSDTECCVAIIRALNSIASENSLDVLLDAATHDDERVRQLAAMGLGAAKEPQANARLIRLLSDDSKSVQRIAIGALARKPLPNTVQALFNCIIDAAAEIRFAAADALKKQEPTQIRAVLERNARSKSAESRRAVVFLAGYFGPQNLLLDGLKDESVNVRKAAALGVATTANKDLGQHLAVALSDPH